MTHVNGEHRVRQAFHVLDATQAPFELGAFTLQLQHFFLHQVVKTAIFFHLLQHAQALDGLLDGAEIGQHAAKPAVGDIRHTATLGFFLDRGAGRTLGADKDD